MSTRLVGLLAAAEVRFVGLADHRGGPLLGILPGFAALGGRRESLQASIIVDPVIARWIDVSSVVIWGPASCFSAGC